MSDKAHNDSWCEECRTQHHPAEPHGLTLTRKLRTVTAEEFGRRIARAFLESKSSSTIFFVQQAFKDFEDDNGLGWEAFQQMYGRFERESVPQDRGPVCHNCGQIQGIPSPDCRYCCLACMPPKE